MKYAIVLCDGMADYPLEALNDETPMAKAQKPAMDQLAAAAEVGLVKTVPNGLAPGSDVANLSVLGYDPAIYYTGRSPLEAASIGIPLQEGDVTLRCNLVTLTDEPDYRQKSMADYCADDISTEEAAELIRTVETELGGGAFHFYPGVSYRHCLVWSQGNPHPGRLTPPHDISGRVVSDFLPQGEAAAQLLDMMQQSYLLLRDHPINHARVERGRRPANSIWLWGEGTRPKLDPFEQKFGVNGSVVSAVDLVKGIGLCAGMTACQVPGTTGYIDTNYEGKLEAALGELRRGQDLVYIHVEAPDECGHRGELENKIRSIELIDEKILAPLAEALHEFGEHRILVLPDHPTPLATRTHAADPVPYLLYRSSGGSYGGASRFDEAHARETGRYLEHGHLLMQRLLSNQPI
jgi:2,3-bisphosphoglycerate-independent phosphoglycerate mutase